MDQKEFLRRMEELVEYGRSKENQLTKEEIADKCSDFSLTEQQYELLYAYLKEHQVHVVGYEAPSVASVTEGKRPAAEERQVEKDSKYLTVYRRELRQLPEYTKEEMDELYERLRSGDESVCGTVIEAHLKRVLTLAGKYRGRGVLLEDLIQEGNLELTACVAMLCGNREVVDFKKAIDHAVRSRLIEMVDEELAGSDSISTVLGRMNLLMEATRTLAEEYGRIATIEELSEFTHMDVGEIRMYVELSRNEIEIGEGDRNGEVDDDGTKK